MGATKKHLKFPRTTRPPCEWRLTTLCRWYNLRPRKGNGHLRVLSRLLDFIEMSLTSRRLNSNEDLLLFYLVYVLFRGHRRRLDDFILNNFPRRHRNIRSRIWKPQRSNRQQANWDGDMQGVYVCDKGAGTLLIGDNMMNMNQRTISSRHAFLTNMFNQPENSLTVEKMQTKTTIQFFFACTRLAKPRDQSPCSREMGTRHP